MTPFDAVRVDATLGVAKTIVGIACSVALGPAGRLTEPVTDILAKQIKSRLEQRSIDRMLEDSVDIVAKRILQSLGNEYREVTDNEYHAAMMAVVESFEKSGINYIEIIRLDLNPNLVRSRVQRTANEVFAGYLLSEAATELARRVLHESCAYLVQTVASMPNFTSIALADVLSRERQILAELRDGLLRMPKSRSTDDFEADYRQIVMNKLDRMELFGISLEHVSSSYPLGIAYVSLEVVRAQHAEGESRRRSKPPLSIGSRVEQVLATLDRTLIIGDAGSGKTTLLRYLAVTNAVKGFAPPLTTWNDRVPFYIPLRSYVEADLPTPGEFPKSIAANIVEEMPNSWVHNLLRSGQALVLIDGLDEMPEGAPRERAQEWLVDLVAQYPKARYVITSRPTVVTSAWPDKSFAIVELQPMSPNDIGIFIRSWHSAIRKELGESSESDSLEGDERAILSAIDTDRNLRRLAVNPLLCALLCALNRDRKRQLPKERMDIYAAALDMLLGRRDLERGITKNLMDPASQRIILRDLAFWLFRQGLATAPVERVQARVQSKLLSLSTSFDDAQDILRYLVTRSGLLREPSVGSIDFVHRTFQEYLAAEAAVQGDEIELLIKNAQDDQWREILIMAVGHSNERQRTALLRGLLDAARKNRSRKDEKTLSLLAVACLETAAELDPGLRKEISNTARKLIPPSSMVEAEYLAPAGDLALQVLADHPPKDTDEAAASVRLASMIAGEKGLDAIATIASKNFGIGHELIRALVAFDPEEYAERVFTRAQLGPTLSITGSDLLPHMKFMTSITRIELDPGDLADLTALGSRPPQLVQLSVSRRPRTTIWGLERWDGLTHLEIIMTHTSPDLYPLMEITSLQSLRLTIKRAIALNLDLSPLRALNSLKHLQIDIDGNATVDVSPMLSHRELRIFVSRSTSVLGQDKLSRDSKVVAVDNFPPLY